MRLQKYGRKQSIFPKIIFFIIWPFGAFLYSLANLKNKSSFLIFFLFCVLFGFTFLPENKSADSYGYIEQFKAIKDFSTSSYLQELSNYSTFKSDIKDIYVLTISYIVMLVTDNYHMFMALLAAVFAFFYLKSFRFLVKRHEFTSTYICYILAFLFTFSNPIFNINGVRFWSAAWIAVYALFQIIVNKNYRYVLLAMVTPLIHISYLSFLVVLLVYLLLNKFERSWIIAFLISFFVTNIALTFIGSLYDYAPTVIQNMIWSYTDEKNLSTRLEAIENLPLYAKILNNLPNLFLNGLMILFIYNRKKIKQNQDAFTVYAFLLVWMTFVNFTWSIPSFGVRYLALSIPFIVYLNLLTLKQIPLLTKLTYLIPFVFAYAIFYWIRNMITISDPYLYFANFIQIIIRNI